MNILPLPAAILVPVAAGSHGKGKSKIRPRRGHEGPEGEYLYNLTLSLTSTLEWGGWSTTRPDHFTFGKDAVPTVQEAGRVRNFSPSPGSDPRTVESVAGRYTDWAIPIHAGSQ